MTGLLSYSAWMIEPGYASRMAPVIFRAIERGTLDQLIASGRANNQQVLSSLYSSVEGQYEQEAGPAFFTTTAKNGKKIAIVTMLGAITKNGDACSHGMRDYTSALTAIAKRQDIGAVVLHFNNAPGGTADGTPELAKFIRSYKKPILSFVDGMAASSHYYFASQADEIMMNKNTPSQVGSIGALMMYQNIQNLVESGQFPTTEIIRAPQSYNKALLNMVEPMTEMLRSELTEDLKDITKQFIDDVKAGRGEKLGSDPELFSGKMYGTTEAIAKGLADSKGTLADAINRVSVLKAGRGRLVISDEQPAAQTNTKSNENMKLPNLSNLLGKPKAAEPKKRVATSAVKLDEHAEEDNTPAWNEELIFNTDGSGDGAYCTHPDADGNARKFETKVDGNQGNEPPTDAEVTEDEFWMVAVAEEVAAPAEESVEALTKVNNAAIAQNVTLTMAVAKLTAQVNKLTTEHTAAKSYIAELEKKLEAAPAGVATQVARETDPGHENEIVSKYYSESDAQLAELKAKLQPQN